jgi:gamma-glutamylcyclotransferase (GGCT)/AIG2-like uncharacterized protein YtfP
MHPADTEWLFAYGSLMHGEENGNLLADLPARSARVHGRLHLHPAGYPVLVALPQGPLVEGELLGPFPKGRLVVLDLFERVGEPGWYRRLRLPLLGEREPEHAWAYAMGEEQVRALGFPPLGSTSWRRRRGRSAPLR